MGAHDFELGIEVQEQVEEACPCCCRMPGGERLQRVIYLLLVSSADRPVVHKVTKANTRGWSTLLDVGLANSIEMRAEASDQPFEEDL